MASCSGSLEVEELVAGAEILGLSEAAAAQLFRELDEDGNGSLDEEEFAEGFLSKRLSFDRINWPLRELYDLLDVDASGSLEVDELMAGAEILGLTRFQVWRSVALCRIVLCLSW